MTPWTIACHVPLSMGFSRQEYWSGLPFPSPEDLSNPGFEPGSLALHADSLLTELPGKLVMGYGSLIHLKAQDSLGQVSAWGGDANNLNGGHQDRVECNTG